MLARYFFRVALIFAAALSMISGAFASASVPLYTTYAVGTEAAGKCGHDGESWGTNVPSTGDVACASMLHQIHNAYLWCGATIWYSGGNQCDTDVSAPLSWLVYQGMGCVSPDVLQPDGSCLAPIQSCVVYPVSSFVESMSGDGDQPLQACMQNCLFNTGSGMSWGISPNRQWASSGRSTGEFCPSNTAAASSANDPACPAGQSLNASGVCAPLAMCPYDATIYAINVNCHPALCPTDASLYASSPLCPAPPASAVPVVVDCAVTPSDPICAGAASGTAPTITGTPGTSGVYQAPTMAPLGISGGTQNGGVTIENCMQTSSGSVVCVDASTTTGEGVELDVIADNVPLGDKVVNIGTITPVLVGTSGSCPAPSPMVLHGHTYYFDWTTYCNFAAWIRPVLLAFAWLAAAGILVGGFVA